MNALTPFEPPPSVVAQVTQLRDMDIQALKDLWRQLYASEPPTHIRAFLEKRLAYRLQELAFKQAQPERALQLDQRIRDLVGRVQAPAKAAAPKLLPGTILTRQYQDGEYQVTVLHDQQFEFEGRLYSNLSAIAREITRTRWSGPLFFGLRKASGITKPSSRRKRT